ncbi:MAG: phosphopyruvate hydratase [SAR324 cluster bacterium]|nr:phosphopyruvate hydratase [SAR324 cluster bacterium]
MPTILKLSALEILDSRGNPTVETSCQLQSGVQGCASVPSGASTGSAEALELRDQDLSRYRGKGCLKAVRHVNQQIAEALTNQTFENQAALDQRLLELDGTINKSALGANALLSVSLAFAKAAAQENHEPLYQYFAALTGNTPNCLPRPMINLFSGGRHAGGQVALQDIQLMPLSVKTMSGVLEMVHEIYYCAADLLKENYQMRLLRADEGGLAPDFADADAMLTLSVEAIRKSGFLPGKEVALTVDVAASEFFEEEKYVLGENKLTSPQMLKQLEKWIHTYPIVSLEDGLSEDDWEHWRLLFQMISEQCLVLGDDLLCTNPKRIRKAIKQQAANALLLKVNQIGTLTEAAESFMLARSADWKVVVSARSGETEDSWLADLAVGWSADHIKVGAITQSERLAKYNRLLAIEKETGFQVVS